MTDEEKKQYLMDTIFEAITVSVDETEGQQTVDLSQINACSPDWIDAPDPELSPDDINRLLHLNDNAVYDNNNYNPWWKYPNEKNNVLTPNDIKDGKATLSGDLTNISLPAEGDLAGHKGEIVVRERYRKPLKQVDGKWQYDDEVKKVKAPAIIDIVIDDVVKITIILTLPEDDKDNEGYPSAEDWNRIKIPDDVPVDDIVKAIIDDEDTSELQNHAVIEFATPSMRDENGCDFTLYVKPGQQINENTIIGTVELDGKKRRIRSIFSKGTVMADDELKSEFKHLYKTAGCNRHFILENYTISGNATDIDTKELEKVQDKFKSEADLFQLITDNLCESALPFILSRRYTVWRFMAMVRWERPNGREIFGKYMEHVQAIREKYQDDLEHLGSADNIKATNGNLRKMKNLGDQIIARRRQYYQEILSAYEDYKPTLDFSEYDPDYNDCKYLAHVHDISEGEESTHTTIGETDYFNYYLALIAKLDLQTDNKYAKKYYEILKAIIEERMSREKYKLEDIQDEFNKIYEKIIDKRCADGFQRLDAVMTGLDDEPTSGDVSAWLTEHIRKKQRNEYTDYSIKQMANMYMFIHGYSEYKGLNYRPNKEGVRVNSLGDQEPKDIYELTKIENRILEKFWKDCISEYTQCTLDNAIDYVHEVADKVNEYAQWPTPGNIRIGTDVYEHYLFQNSVAIIDDEEMPDEDLGTEYETTAPALGDDFPVPEATIDDMPMGPDNPQVGEISIKDLKYWQKYFGICTILSLVPTYWNCGLDIPPYIMNIPLPVIYIAMSVVYIKMLDISIVFGLSIRGMYIWPVILFVNCGNMPASIMTPLISQIKSIQSKISAKINAIAEKPITAIADGFIQMLENDNRQLRQQNKQLENYLISIKQRKAEGDEQIKRDMQQLLKPGSKPTQQVIDPLSSEFNE